MLWFQQCAFQRFDVLFCSEVASYTPSLLHFWLDEALEIYIIFN